MANDDAETDTLDTLVGAKRIADYAGLNIRQAFHLLEQGILPAQKLGRRWVTTKSQIRRRLGAEA
jgi:hypothetical protein